MYLALMYLWIHFSLFGIQHTADNGGRLVSFDIWSERHCTILNTNSHYKLPVTLRRFIGVVLWHFAGFTMMSSFRTSLCIRLGIFVAPFWNYRFQVIANNPITILLLNKHFVFFILVHWFAWWEQWKNSFNRINSIWEVANASGRAPCCW